MRQAAITRKNLEKREVRTVNQKGDRGVLEPVFYLKLRSRARPPHSPARCGHPWRPRCRTPRAAGSAPKFGPTVFDSAKRGGSSIAVFKVTAAIGLTPRPQENRRQIRLRPTSCASNACSRSYSVHSAAQRRRNMRCEQLHTSSAALASR